VAKQPMVKGNLYSITWTVTPRRFCETCRSRTLGGYTERSRVVALSMKDAIEVTRPHGYYPDAEPLEARLLIADFAVIVAPKAAWDVANNQPYKDVDLESI